MKVGVLIDRLNVGGVEKIAIQEVSAFRSINVDATLLVLSRKAVVKNAFADLRKNIPIIYLDDRLPSFLRFTFKIPYFYFFSSFHITYPLLLPFVVKKREFDVLISHNTYTSFTALTLSYWNKIPYLMFVWDPIAYILQKAYKTSALEKLLFILLPIGTAVDKILVRRAKAVLVSGDMHAIYLRSILKKDTVHFVSPGYDHSKTIPAKRGNYIITVTAWKEGKGLERLLDILSQIKDIELQVVGKWIHPSYLKNIQKKIKELNLGKRVTLSGEVSEKTLQKLFLHARVNIITNNERGFGLSVLEAAANGSTSIFPNECGAARYFVDKKDCYLYPYSKTAYLKNYLHKLVGDERLSYQMGKHAWKTVVEKYSFKNHALLLKKIIEES